MLENNNLILIDGKPATYKSSLGISILNSSNKKCCYIDLEGNKHIPINNNIKVYNGIDDIDNYINENDIILIDYIEILNYSIEDIIKLKGLVDNANKTLILISCCSSNKNLFNDNYNRLKEISDLVLTTDK